MDIGASLNGRSVLIVEDESMVAMFLQDTLEDIGCTVIGLAPRLNEALKKAASLVFDIAILDVNLNGSSSFPVAEVLRARGLPFIFATGYSRTSLPEFLQRVPIVQKPFQQRELETAICTALSQKAEE